MKLRPLSDRVVVKPTEAEKTTKGGLVIPDSAKEKPMEGEVVAVGPGRLRDDGGRAVIDLKAGDKVLYSKYGGTLFQIEEEDLLILSEEDILGVIES